MANHKRRRPKHQRAGCLHCKPYKDERYKDSFNAQPMEMRRELQDDRAAQRTPSRKSKKKDTLTWCGGKEGRRHKPRWVSNRGRYGTSSFYNLRCDACGKKLGHYSKWAFQSTPTIRVRRFPGHEAFLTGPCLTKAA